jgi:predicted ATPase
MGDDLNAIKLDFTAVMNVGREEEMQTLLSALKKFRVDSGRDKKPRSRQNRHGQGGSASSPAIFIHGASGIGKSKLVDAFWEQAVTRTDKEAAETRHGNATATRCLFCRGTFEEGRSDSDPFSAVTASFNMLIQSLLKESSNGMPTSKSTLTKSASVSTSESYWKAKFTETLKEEAPVLGTIIP